MGPSHGIAVGQHRVPSPSHDVVLPPGGGGGGGGGGEGGWGEGGGVGVLVGVEVGFLVGGGWGGWGPDFSGGCLSPTLHLLIETCLCRWPLASK